MSERTERQERLLEELSKADRPLTGSELATRCDVTRQVVVHDIAIIRASGVNIISTPRGYQLQQTEPHGNKTVLSVFHTPEFTEAELTTLVDFGIEVVDVIVEHAVYGELRGDLHLSSRRDIALFLQQLRETDALLLSSLTEGFHLHTVIYPHRDRLFEAIKELKEKGIQVFDCEDIP